MDQTNRFNRLIYNEPVMRAMTTIISEKLRKRMTPAQVKQFFEFVKGSRTQPWGEFNKQQIQQVLIHNYLTLHHTKQGRNTIKKTRKVEIDVHELMKLHIGTPDKEVDYTNIANVDENGVPKSLASVVVDEDEGLVTLGSLDRIKTISSVNDIKNVKTVQDVSHIIGRSSVTDIQMMFNPAATYRKNYIVLDSRNRLTDSDGTQKQAWDFLQNSTINTIGATNSLQNVKNVVSIGVPHLRIPYLEEMTLTGLDRVTLLIEEFKGQSVIGPEGRRYHWMFDIVVDGSFVKLIPLGYDSGYSEFKFAKPITQIDKFTLSWGNPFTPLIFDKDRLNFTITYTNPIRFTATEVHKLNTGDSVVITDFTTDDPAADETLIFQVNEPHGLNIFVIDDFTFDVDIDATVVTAPTAGLSIEIFFNSKRFITGSMELTYQHSE